MAESNSKSGILALAQKRISRTKTKVLQNLGKAEKTTDDVFNENVLRVERQQEIAHHLQKELKTYVHCLREMNQASLSLTTVLSEIYEPEWTKESTVKNQLQVFELLWNDFLQSVQDSVVAPLNNYLQSFPVLKSKVAKRGRKMVDYDNCRHHLEVLLSAKKKDEVKIHKAQEEMKEAKRIYEELNSELRSELPDFNNSRVTFYASLLSSLFGAGHVFHSEFGKVYLTLEDICQELSKDFEQFKYRPRQTLSKSVSSNSGENGFSDEVSAQGSPSVQLTRSSVDSRCNSSDKDTSQSVYNNQEVPEIKQRCYQPKRKAPVAPSLETFFEEVQELSSNCLPARQIPSETSCHLHGRAAVAEFSRKYFTRWKNKFTHKYKKSSAVKHVSVEDSVQNQHPQVVGSTGTFHSTLASCSGQKKIPTEGKSGGFSNHFLTNMQPLYEEDRQVVMQSDLYYHQQGQLDKDQIRGDSTSHEIDSFKDMLEGLPLAGQFQDQQKARCFQERQAVHEAAGLHIEASNLSLVGSLKNAGKELPGAGQLDTSKREDKVFPGGQLVGEATDTEASSLSSVVCGEEAERDKECVQIALKSIPITQSVPCDSPGQVEDKGQPPFDQKVRQKPQGNADKDSTLLTPPSEHHVVDPCDTHPVELVAVLIYDSAAPDGAGAPPVDNFALSSQEIRESLSNFLKRDDDDGNKKMSPKSPNFEDEKVTVGEISKLSISKLKASAVTSDGSARQLSENDHPQIEMLAFSEDLDLGQPDRFPDVGEEMERETPDVTWDDTVRMWVGVDTDNYIDEEPLLGDISDDDNDAEFFTVRDGCDFVKVESKESIKDVEEETTLVQNLLPPADTSKYYTMAYVDVSSVDQSDDDQLTESSPKNPVEYHELEPQTVSAEKAQTSTAVKIFDSDKATFLTQHLLNKHSMLVPHGDTASSTEKTITEVVTTAEMTTSAEMITSAEELSSNEASRSPDDSSEELMNQAKHRKNNICAVLASNKMKLLNEHLVTGHRLSFPRNHQTGEKLTDNLPEAVCASTEVTEDKKEERNVQKPDSSEVQSTLDLDKHREEIQLAGQANLLFQSKESFDAVICSINSCGLPKTEVRPHKSRSFEDTFSDPMPDVWGTDKPMEDSQVVSISAENVSQAMEPCYRDDMEDLASQECRFSSKETLSRNAERKRAHIYSILSRQSSIFYGQRAGKSKKWAAWKQSLSKQQQLFQQMNNSISTKPGIDSSSSGCLLQKKNMGSLFGPCQISTCKSLPPLLPASRWSLDCVRFIKNMDRNVCRDETEDESNLSDSSVSLEVKIDRHRDPEISNLEKVAGKTRSDVHDGSGWSFKGFMNMLLPQTVQILASHTKSYVHSCVHSRPSDRHLQEINKIVMECLTAEDYHNLLKRSCEGSSVDITAQQDSPPSPQSSVDSPLSQTRILDELKLGNLDALSLDRDSFYTPEQSLTTPATPKETDIKYVDSSPPALGAVSKEGKHLPTQPPDEPENSHDQDVALLEKHFQTVMRDIITKGSSHLRKVKEGVQSPPSYSRSPRCEGGKVRSTEIADVGSSEECEQEKNMFLHGAMLSRLQMSLPVLARSENRPESKPDSEDLSDLGSWAVSRELIHSHGNNERLEPKDDSFKSCHEAVGRSEIKQQSAADSDGMSGQRPSEKPVTSEDRPSLNLTAVLAQRRIALTTVQDEDECCSQDESDKCSHSCQSSSASAATSGSPVLSDHSREAYYDYLALISGSQNYSKIPTQRRRFEPSLSLLEGLVPTQEDHCSLDIWSQNECQRQISDVDVEGDSLRQRLNLPVAMRCEAAADTLTLDMVHDSCPRHHSEESSSKSHRFGSVLECQRELTSVTEHAGKVEVRSGNTVHSLVTVQHKHLAICDTYKEKGSRSCDLINREPATKMPLLSTCYKDGKHIQNCLVDSELLASSHTVDMQSQKHEEAILRIGSSSNNGNIKTASGFRSRSLLLQNCTRGEATGSCQCQDKKLGRSLRFFCASEYCKDVVEKLKLCGCCNWDWTFSSGQLLSYQKCQLQETVVGLPGDDVVCRSLPCGEVEGSYTTHGLKTVVNNGFKEDGDIDGVDVCEKGSNLQLLLKEHHSLGFEECVSTEIQGHAVLVGTQLPGDVDGGEMIKEHIGGDSKYRCGRIVGVWEKLEKHKQLTGSVCQIDVLPESERASSCSLHVELSGDTDAGLMNDMQDMLGELTPMTGNNQQGNTCGCNLKEEAEIVISVAPTTLNTCRCAGFSSLSENLAAGTSEICNNLIHGTSGDHCTSVLAWSLSENVNLPTEASSSHKHCSTTDIAHSVYENMNLSTDVSSSLKHYSTTDIAHSVYENMNLPTGLSSSLKHCSTTDIAHSVYENMNLPTEASSLHKHCSTTDIAHSVYENMNLPTGVSSSLKHCSTTDIAHSVYENMNLPTGVSSSLKHCSTTDIAYSVYENMNLPTGVSSSLKHCSTTDIAHSVYENMNLPTGVSSSLKHCSTTDIAHSVYENMNLPTDVSSSLKHCSTTDIAHSVYENMNLPTGVSSSLKHCSTTDIAHSVYENMNLPTDASSSLKHYSTTDISSSLSENMNLPTDASSSLKHYSTTDISSSLSENMNLPTDASSSFKQMDSHPLPQKIASTSPTDRCPPIEKKTLRLYTALSFRAGSSCSTSSSLEQTDVSIGTLSYLKRVDSFAGRSLPFDKPGLSTSADLAVDNLRGTCDGTISLSEWKDDVCEGTFPAVEKPGLCGSIRSLFGTSGIYTSIPVDNIDVPVDNTDVPLVNIDVPVDNIDVPVENIDVPVDNTDVPLVNIDVPVDNIDVPVDNIDVPVENIDVPVDNTDVPLVNIDVPVDNIDVPVDNIDVPVDNTDVPLVNIDVPVDNIDVPVDNIDVPVDNIDVPVDNIDVPVDNIDVPVDNIDVPVDNIDVSVDNTDVSVDNTDVPVDNTDVPVDNTDVPVDNLGTFGCRVPQSTETGLLSSIHPCCQNPSSFSGMSSSAGNSGLSSRIGLPVAGKFYSFEDTVFLKKTTPSPSGTWSSLLKGSSTLGTRSLLEKASSSIQMQPSFERTSSCLGTQPAFGMIVSSLDSRLFLEKFISSLKVQSSFEKIKSSVDSRPTFKEVNSSLGTQSAFEKIKSSVDSRPTFEEVNSSLGTQSSFEKIKSSVDSRPTFEEVNSSLGTQSSFEKIKSSVDSGPPIEEVNSSLGTQSTFEKIKSSVDSRPPFEEVNSSLGTQSTFEKIKSSVDPRPPFEEVNSSLCTQSSFKSTIPSLGTWPLFETTDSSTLTGQQIVEPARFVDIRHGLDSDLKYQSDAHFLRKIDEMLEELVYNQTGGEVTLTGNILQTPAATACYLKTAAACKGDGPLESENFGKDPESDFREPCIMEPNLTETYLREPNLTETYLREPYLREPNLTETYLREPYLREPNLTETYLREPYLRGPKLTEPYLTETDFKELYLRESDLKEPHLRTPYLSEPDLRESDLTGPHLRGSDLTEPYLRESDLTEPYLRESDLTESHLTEPYLRESDPTEPHLTEADLSESDLRESDLRESHFTEPYLRESDLTEPYLRESDLTEPYLRESDLTESYLRGSDLTEPNLRESDLTEPNLRESDLREPYLRESDLTEPNLRESDLTESNLRELDLKESNLTELDLREPYSERTSIQSFQHNGSNPVPAERTDKRLSNIPAQDKSNNVDERGHSEEDNNNSSIEHKEMTHNVYNEPHETPSNLAASVGRVSNHHEFSESDSDDGEDDDLEPVYSNPPSHHPLTNPPPNTLFVVQAVHRYVNEDEDELSFEPGELIYVIKFDNPEEQDDGWQMGIKASDGVRGVFPENFTQVLPNQAK